MILLDQLNCMALLAGVCLDCKLQLVEQDGRGGLEWAPNCTISLQISSTSEMSLGTCPIRVFRLFESVFLVPPVLLAGSRSISPWSGWVLFCRWQKSGGEWWRGNYSLCPELIWINVVGTYALSPEEKSDFMSRAVGKRHCWGQEAADINTPNIYRQKHSACQSEGSLLPKTEGSCLLLTREVFMSK